jgi:tetratricopeptide (TPR) repeat protein
MKTMNRLGLVAAVCAFAGLAAGCSTVVGGLTDPTYNPETERVGTAYGSFLAAQYAGRVSDRRAATDFYRAALNAAPDDQYLVESAFTAALRNGDLDEAAELAEPMLGRPGADPLARVLLASRSVREGRYQEAVDLLQETDLGRFNRIIGSLVLAWAYDGLHQPDEALAVLSAPTDAPILGHLMTLHRAMVLERAGRLEEADAAYAEALSSGLMRSVVVDAYGRRLERAGRSDEARELYVSQLEEFPGDAAARAGLDRIAAGGRAPATLAATPAEGASLAVLGPAATLASNQSNASDLAVIYLRLALYLDPKNGLARQLLGDMLANARLDVDALAVYSGVDKSSPFYDASKVAEAYTLLRLDRSEEAIALLQKLYADSDSSRVNRALADAYRALERYDEALAIYDQLVADEEAAGRNDDWDLYYSRGVSHERTGDWRAAEADFQHALAILPEDSAAQAQVLNYLGYTWVDRGERLEEAFAMINRAVELEPDSGYIVDSLGWAHFKRGEYDVAVGHLERAVELDPQDPTINEHLGDAYWRVGRFLEASYQWRRSLTLEPDPELRAALENKLANGLPPLQEDEPSLIASP